MAKHGQKKYLMSNGEKYTANELAVLSGVCYQTIYARLKKHGDNFKKVTLPFNTNKSLAVKFLYKGEYLTVKQLSTINGVQPSTIRSRINIHKESVELAILICCQRKLVVRPKSIPKPKAGSVYTKKKGSRKT